jgi:hypothetical protein
MSYILDALKKAERDRLRDDPQRLDDFTSAAWDPYQPIRTKKSVSKAMVVLVIIATCVLFAFYSVGGFRLFQIQDQATDDLSLDLSIDKQKTIEKIQVEPERSSELPIEIEVEANQVVLEPDFLIAGHMFITQGSSSNRLFIGDSSYKAGDMLDTNWMLFAINADHFVVQAGTRVEIIAYR